MLAENYLSRKGYRLPSEAEWEFCSRGGLLSAYPSGDTSHRLNLFEWFASNSENRPHPVRERMPNAFGMFDMLGNVREWCMERYESEFPRPRAEINPDIEDQRIVDRSDYRLVRGGDFESNAIELRYTHRQPLNGYKRRGTIGFRVVRTLD